MTLFSYVVRWDHGFAPNPFHGVCTLATCKPAIRKKVKQGDWVLGTGSAERGYQSRVIFLMQVEEISDFDRYWGDTRFNRKRPVMNGSLKQRFGDNIYHRGSDGVWIQADSRHSWNGSSNNQNLLSDTGTTDRVLIGSNFIYWGENAPPLPTEFGHFAIRRPGWKDDFSDSEIGIFIAWARSLGDYGQVGNPVEWRYERWWR